MQQTQRDVQSPNTDNALTFVKNLYQYVDNKDINALAECLSEKVKFRIGNYDMLQGKEAVLQANTAFFTSISSMRHQITTTWVQDQDIICHGQVHYVRLDNSTHTVPFATVLQLHQGKIDNYLVFVDLSEL